MAEAHPIPTSATFKNLTGKTFGRLRVISFAGRKGNLSQWNVLCDPILGGCGTERKVLAGNLHKGHTKSCGCLAKEEAATRGITHGRTGTSEYYTYGSMIGRCHRATDPNYKHYGGRGIFVCERWLKSFENFYADMGPRPTPRHTIDRIDNNKGYSPENCRWITMAEQSRNRRSNILITINGETKCATDWAKLNGLRPALVVQRIRRDGWSPELALLPIGTKRPILPFA